MARSRLREDQVLDVEFLSEDEHSALDHYFADLADTPPTLSGYGGKLLRVKNDGTAIEYDNWTELYPRSYTPPSGTVNFNFSGGYSEPAADDVDFIFDIFYSIAKGDRVFVNSTDEDFMIILPLAPTMGDFVSLIDGGGYCASNNVTISGSGQKIMGSYSLYTVNENFSSFDLVYYNETSGWIIK